jgi:alkylation response protein AidB-like acyl-CoA dehydrogenase
MIDFAYSEKEQSLRREVAEFCRANLPREVLARAYRHPGGGYYSREIWEILRRRGWLFPHWSPEEGGVGLTPLQHAIFIEELCYHLIQVGAHHACDVVRLAGTPEQKATYLPRFAAGEWLVTIGISEPNAGADAANIEMRARRAGDDWVLNGQKMWGGHGTPEFWGNNLHICVARTDPDKERHEGLTIFLVPLTTPGITIRPVHIMRGAPTADPVAATYYEDVRVPHSAILGGALNGGWHQMTHVLNDERFTILTANVGRAARLHDDLIAHVRRAEGSRAPEWVRTLLADLYIELEAVRCMSYEAAAHAEQGDTPDGVALGGVKIAAAELYQHMGEAALQILGPYGLSDDPEAPHGEPLADIALWYAMGSRQATTAGGSAEVMLNRIATGRSGLGLPRR